MSGKFDGFSREDINKITAKPKKTVRPMLTGRGINRLQNTTKSTNSTSNMVEKNNANNENLKGATFAKESLIMVPDKLISDESMTSLQEAIHFRPLSAVLATANKKPTEQTDDLQKDQSIISNESILNVENIKNYDAIIAPNTNEKSATVLKQQLQSSPFKGISLKDFETDRKLRQEQNKQKKELLYQAIERHTQKTAAEVKKIAEIKTELSKLDDDLAADVAILRKQIDLACIHYSNIEKHYNKIEGMFLKAKMELHNASEKKELLTEHLCTVITHNEDRKAHKLSELMDKVGILPSGDEFDNNHSDKVTTTTTDSV